MACNIYTYIYIYIYIYIYNFIDVVCKIIKYNQNN